MNMLNKLNLKFVGIIAGTVLFVLAGFFIRQTYFGDKACHKYMTVGGKDNPCQCTQRIER
jgi:hypothetical protein